MGAYIVQKEIPAASRQLLTERVHVPLQPALAALLPWDLFPANHHLALEGPFSLFPHVGIGPFVEGDLPGLGLLRSLSFSFCHFCLLHSLARLTSIFMTWAHILATSSRL